MGFKQRRQLKLVVLLNLQWVKRDRAIGDFKGQGWLIACASGTIHFLSDEHVF